MSIYPDMRDRRMHVLMLTYRLTEEDRVQHAELCEELAPAFAAVPGLVSKTWLSNDATGRHGAFYVFETKGAFDAFVASELFATILWHPLLKDPTAIDFAVNQRPTSVTRGPTQESRGERRLRWRIRSGLFARRVA